MPQAGTIGRNSAPAKVTMKPNGHRMFRAHPARIGSVIAFCMMLALLGACSKRENQNQEIAKPVVFFAPATVTNVPDVYKPLYLGELPADRLAAFRAGLPYESISLERISGAASNLVYRVTLYRSGQAELTTNAPPPKTGKFTGQIDLFTFARLCYALDNNRFNELQNQYRADPLEKNVCIVTVSTGESKKTVTDYGTIGPIELWTIEQVIDGTRRSIDWKPVPKPK